jgi:hypothetical protein
MAEYNRERNGGEQRLNDVPERTEDGLLVGGDKIAPDEHGDEIAVAPQLFQAPVEPAAMRRDGGRPAFVGDG